MYTRYCNQHHAQGLFQETRRSYLCFLIGKTASGFYYFEKGSQVSPLLSLKRGLPGIIHSGFDDLTPHQGEAISHRTTQRADSKRHKVMSDPSFLCVFFCPSQSEQGSAWAFCQKAFPTLPTSHSSRSSWARLPPWEQLGWLIDFKHATSATREEAEGEVRGTRKLLAPCADCKICRCARGLKWRPNLKKTTTKNLSL